MNSSLPPFLEFRRAMLTIAPAGGVAGFGLLTNPWTAGIGGGLLAAGLWTKSQAHHEANSFVRQIQQPYERQLAEISALARTDPVSAQERLIRATQDFVQQAERFAAQGGDAATVARQALTTPGLVQTVQALTEETGLRRFMGGDYPDPTRTGAGGWLVNIADLFRAINIPELVAKQSPIGSNTGGIGPGGSGTGTGAGGRGPIRSTGNPTLDEQLRQMGYEIQTGARGFLDRYGDLIFGGAGLVTGLLDRQASQQAISEALQAQTDAAKYAADLQSKAATEALGLQREMYQQSRQDTLPWLEQGRLSLYSLTDALGLERGPAAASLGLPAPVPWAGHAPGPLPGPGPQPPPQPPGPNVFQELAQRYRR
jgi:hypothetical protein